MFLVSESKLGYMFPSNQFRIDGYKIFRLDNNRFGGGLIFYINENILCKPLQEHVHLPNFEVIAIEFNQNNQKWFLLDYIIHRKTENRQLYSKSKLNIGSFFKKNHDNVTLIKDFNLSSGDVPLEIFLQVYKLTSLIKKVTCFSI